MAKVTRDIKSNKYWTEYRLQNQRAVMWLRNNREINAGAAGKYVGDKSYTYDKVILELI